MAEELKQEEKKAQGNRVMPTILKVVLGIGFLILGVLAILRWRWDLLILIKGCIGLFLVLAGIITLAIAKE